MKPVSRKFRCLGALLLILLFAPALPAAEELSDVMESWFSAESALYRWQDTSVINEELFSALERFRISLNDFTASLLFTEYNRTGLIPKESGTTVSRMTDSLAASVASIMAMKTEENWNDYSEAVESARAAALPEAAVIRQELNFWFRTDSLVSSHVFNRFTYITAVFLFCIIVLAAAMGLLYRALNRSRKQEQDSADFSRITMLIQEKERALISAELHDTVLQDLGRLVQISKDAGPLPALPLTELAGKITDRTREICRTLMPPDFSRLALEDSLVQLCADFEKRAAVECRAIIAPDFSVDRLSPQMQLQVYRIVQESLTNIEKHAKAAEVTRPHGTRMTELCLSVSPTTGQACLNLPCLTA